MADASKPDGQFKPLEKTMLPKKAAATGGAEPPKKTPLGGSASMVDIQAKLREERLAAAQGGPKPVDLTDELTSEIGLLPTDNDPAPTAAPVKPAAPVTDDSVIIELTEEDSVPSKSPAAAPLVRTPPAKTKEYGVAEDSAPVAQASANVAPAMNTPQGKASAIQTVARRKFGNGDGAVHISASYKKDPTGKTEGTFMLLLPAAEFKMSKLQQLGFDAKALGAFRQSKNPRDMWEVPDSVALPSAAVLSKYIAFEQREVDYLKPLVQDKRAYAAGLKKVVGAHLVKHDDATFIMGLKPTDDPQTPGKPAVPKGIFSEEDDFLIAPSRYVQVHIPADVNLQPLETLLQETLQAKPQEPIPEVLPAQKKTGGWLSRFTGGSKNTGPSPA